MSFFAVTLRKIEKIWAYADPAVNRIELANVSDTTFQFVVRKGEFKVGEEVLYFPIDSLLPDNVLDKMGLKGKLHGPGKNRLRTVKLRQEISQGLVARPTDFFTDDSWRTMTPEQLTETLGVTKYEPEAISCKACRLISLPDGVSVYDIEGADGNIKIVEMLMDQKVCLTEKLEGMNYAASILNNELSVCTRKHKVEPIPEAEHTFWTATKNQGLDKIALELAKRYEGKRVTLRGEMVGPGIQSNIYKLLTHKVFLFDILMDGNYLPSDEFFKVCTEFNISTVPVLATNVTLREWLNGRTIKDACHGKSILFDTLREGIVIKPLVEQEIHKFGRLILKSRDPIYLAGSDS